VPQLCLSSNCRQTRLHTAALLLVCLFTASVGLAQTKSGSGHSPYIGDDPDNPGPLATDLSPALRHTAIHSAMSKVADWELARTEGHLEQDWTFAALYQGWIAASDTLKDPKYINAVEKISAEDFQWKIGPRTAHADDEAIAQSYLDIFRKKHDQTMIANTKESFNTVMATPDNPDKPLWWWCDALFMAPRAWLLLSQETKNPAYLNYMDRQWWITSNLLYDGSDHLYSRDKSYLNSREANGKKIYWSRGDGWVAAGIVRVIQDLPKDFPNRSKYIEQYKQMSEAIASLQGSDGLWRPGLLDADSYPLPEVSGSAFFVYSLAWGINHNVIDRHKYLPVVEKGWKGLVSHIYQDGRLGCIQPVGAAPGKYTEGSSYNFGIGAFLLAGSEVDHLAK
jgi:unsaturated rhamnogalacturonyl hydrolase